LPKYLAVVREAAEDQTFPASLRPVRFTDSFVALTMTEKGG
jgi:hypothetical protein